jgi:hypothetical protein
MDNEHKVSIPAFASDVDVLVLSDERPVPNPVDAIYAQHRGYRHRLVPFEPNYGQPIVNPPKPDPATIKLHRKMLKRLRRGLPIGKPPVIVPGPSEESGPGAS